MRPLDKGLLAVNVGFAVIAMIAVGRALLIGAPGDLQKSLLAVLVWLSFACLAYRRISASRKEHEAFVAKMAGVPWDEALSAAEASCVKLARGLVEAKVKLPVESWTAFERKTFQFVLFRDTTGTTKVLTL
jgi:hypothetical protein